MKRGQVEGRKDCAGVRRQTADGSQSNHGIDVRHLEIHIADLHSSTASISRPFLEFSNWGDPQYVPPGRNYQVFVLFPRKILVPLGENESNPSVSVEKLVFFFSVQCVGTLYVSCAATECSNF